MAQGTVKSLVSTLNSKTTSSVVKNVSDGTLDCNRLMKVGNTVFASSRIHSLPNVPTNQNFFIIPEGFRPKNSCYVSGYANITHGGQSYMGMGLFFFVNTNGEIGMSYSSTATTSQVFFSGSWSVD